MDDYTRDLLKSWDLDCLVDNFKDNCIDKRSLEHLTPQLMKELIPQIGLRIQFCQKWEERFQTNQTVIDERNESVNVHSTSSVSSEDDTTNKENVVPLLRRKRLSRSLDVFRTLQRPSVNDILQLTIQGCAILKSYKRNKVLSRKCRNTVVDLILSEILNNIKGPLKNEDFESISKEIEEVFPTETRITYYIPPVAKRHSRHNISITSRGKLVDKYWNKIRDFKKLAGHSYTDCDSPSTSTSCTTEIDDDSTVCESVSWLQKHVSPWPLVQSHWTVTFAYRRNQIIKSRNKNVADIFCQWPVLKLPTAYTLIDEDFKSLNLTSEDCLNNWFFFFSAIQNVCPLKRYTVTDELHSVFGIADLTNDTKVVTQLLLLPHFIPPKGRIRLKKEHFKPSINESKHSIIHAKIHGDISHIQDEKRKTAERLGLTIQPYIIVVGPTLAEVATFYVCIDKTLYQVPTALMAIDVCFKIFHVFDVSYPAESEQIWYIIQRSLYKFSTKYDKPISYVMPIINSLNTRVSTDD